MSTPLSAPGESQDSAAKLMLEALSKASAELEKTVNVLTDQLANFNQNLEKSFQDEVNSSKERMESALRQNLDGLLRDKESVMKLLAEFKQAEIEKVIMSGKMVRSGLAAQVEDTTRSLSSTVAGKITEIRGQLSQPEAEMKRKYDETHQALQATIAQASQALAQATVAEQQSISTASQQFDLKLAEVLSTGQAALEESFSRRRSELESQGDQVVGELAQKYDEVIGRLESSNHQGLLTVGEKSAESVRNLKQISDAGAEYFAEQDKNFLASLTNLSGLLNGLYETRLNNLAAQSRTEINSAAQHAEECLINTKAELQMCLREFQRDYVAEFEGLFTKLEKTLEEFAKKKDSGAMRGLKEERVREQLQSLFRRLGQEMIDSSSAAARRLETEFQKSMDSFAQRIETAKTQSCESLDRESKLMQKELSRSFQEFDKQLQEMQAQTVQLESAGRDAANIVMTIRQANLEF